MLGAECSANGSSWHWDVGSCIDYLLLKGSWVGCSNRAEWVLCRGVLQTVGDMGNNSGISHWVRFTKERQLLSWEGWRSMLKWDGAPLSGLGTPVYFHLLILFLFRLTGFAGFASIKIGEWFVYVILNTGLERFRMGAKVIYKCSIFQFLRYSGIF